MTGPGPTRRRLPLARLLAVAAGLVVLVVAGRTAAPHLEGFIHRVQGLGPWGPTVFIAGYVAACVAFVPAWILTVAAGLLFGVVRGVIYVFTGAVLGSAAAFLVARYLARGAIERRIAGNERFAAVDRAIARRGLLIVFLLRLSPVFPFNLLNYALGLTRVRFRDYLAAGIGMLPGTVLYVYSGTALGSAAQLASGAPAGGWGRTALLATGLLATVAVTVVVTRIARQALDRATAGAS
jgi:uncharacterized membrane protein YdjX (TVP38/TMEM64 family)